MLRELHIKNFAIIESLNLSFSGGLNVLSGETGTGKSIIVGALTLVLGGRSSPEVIRSSEKSSTVEALFEVGPRSPIRKQLEKWEMAENEDLVVKRVISHTGKSKAFINGNLATLQMLNQLGRELISFSGQHEHQTLFQIDKHLDVLDDFGGFLSLKEQVARTYSEFLEVFQRRKDIEEREGKKEQMKELLRFQIKEIEDARLEKGEDERLGEEKKIMSNAQKLIEHAGVAYDAIYQCRDSALERLREAAASLKGVVAVDESTSPLYSSLETILYQAEDTAHSIKEYMQKISFDERRQEEIEERLDEINKLKKKYGGSLEEVCCFNEQAKEELARIESDEETLLALKKEQQDLEEKTIRLALELSKKREKAATLLGVKVEKELLTLGMKKITFKVKIEKEKAGPENKTPKGVSMGGFRITEKGVDLVEFLFSPNPGEDLRPLAKIASGGELSRIILALKRIGAQKRGVATLIFDEVDSGIGGATAEVVGVKLKEVSLKQQTLCITHLPQIASFADLHQSISKKVRNGRTSTVVKKLDSKKEREEEIARMLGGATITGKTREHAREMLALAQKRG